MLKALTLVLFMIMSVPAFAAYDPNDTNLDKEDSTVEDYKRRQLSQMDRICVSAQCYQNNYAGADIGECSTPPILPEGSYDPCNPLQTAEAPTTGNTFEQ